MNPVMDAILTRRSVRSFTGERISRPTLEQLVEAARYAPSGMNKQLWKFTVVQDPALLQRLAGVIARELGRDEDYNFYGANALILASNDRDNPHGVEDCACALENIFLAAHSMGVGSVWINQLKGICDVPAVRQVLDQLHLPQNHVVLGMAALGYPAGPAPKAVKRSHVAEWFLGPE